MALRITRRLLEARPSVREWPARDPTDKGIPSYVGLTWIRAHAQEIVEMTDAALKSGDLGEHLRVIAESNRLGQKIRVQAHQTFRSASGGIAHLEDEL